MDRVDAEEYTQALGQIVGGSWRQIRLAQKLGVPNALELSLDEWVKNRLGGYIRLEISDRREAVKELTAEGLSTREVAEVVGVDHSTVVRDIVGANAPITVPKQAVFGANAPERPVEAKKNAEWEKFEAERNQRQGLYVGLREIERWAYLFNEGAQRDYMVACFVEHRDEIDEQTIVRTLAQMAKNIIETLEGIRDEQIRRTGEAFTSRVERGH